MIILYIEPMARNVREITNLKPPKYQDCSLDAMKKTISTYTETQKRSTYGFILARDKPGSFYFVYQHVGSRPKYEYVTVRPEGFVFRNKIFKRVEELIGGFKKMEQQKAAERKKGSSRR
jgi:transcription elongation factor SPT6